MGGGGRGKAAQLESGAGLAGCCAFPGAALLASEVVSLQTLHLPALACVFVWVRARTESSRRMGRGSAAPILGVWKIWANRNLVPFCGVYSVMVCGEIPK